MASAGNFTFAEQMCRNVSATIASIHRNSTLQFYLQELAKAQEVDCAFKNQFPGSGRGCQSALRTTQCFFLPSKHCRNVLGWVLAVKVQTLSLAGLMRALTWAISGLVVVIFLEMEVG